MEAKLSHTHTHTYSSSPVLDELLREIHSDLCTVPEIEVVERSLQIQSHLHTGKVLRGCSSIDRLNMQWAPIAATCDAFGTQQSGLYNYIIPSKVRFLG